MEINIWGLVMLIVFYLLILVVGVIAARKKKVVDEDENALETSIVAGRQIGKFVGIFTMTATTVGGGYINGTAESIATYGLVNTLAPFGIFIGLSLGGLIFAKKMREQCYLTMLDPLQELYGGLVTVLVYLASLWGDLFWTASILSALGSTLSVIVNIDLSAAIISSAAVTVLYTMIGQMFAVAYTDIVQLVLISVGLVLCVPFVLTNEKIGDISQTTDVWIGQFDVSFTPQWMDLFIAMTFGTIPWQSYFQRVLSVKGGKEARILSFFGGLSALVLVTPSILIGAAAVTADWKNTSLGLSPLDPALNQSSMVLPHVLKEFTPPAVSIIGLGAICAAVMSSMDSSILGSSSMFTNNIYREILRPKASQRELLWIQRISILVLGSLATVISLSVPGVYGLFILAADVVFVIVLPQLVCALFLSFTNIYGAMTGFIVGSALRMLSGEPSIQLPVVIYFPWYSDAMGQLFPFRTVAFLCSFISIVLASFCTRTLLRGSQEVNELDSVSDYSLSNYKGRTNGMYTLHNLNSSSDDIGNIQ